MIIFAILLASSAAAFWYIASTQQRLLARRAGRAARMAGWVLAVAALALAIASIDTLPGIFGALSALMLGGITLPYVAWWLKPASARERQP
ncbi:hypothetical protein [Pinirhizobacter soli]|uniref:hypothetical protein n=1 Tax=Pinirhizobacter soli TaxID=2786953 RepID=UPI002029CD8C|nr:hypothetical protein [Pinirhizobacter soli]